jgi:tetratricopeptide (TPR) repeat protein
MSQEAEPFLEKALRAAFALDAAPPVAGAVADEVPARVGRFRVDGVVGHGGMGLVLRGYDAELDRPVAIKLLRERRADDPSAVRSFLEEARIGGGLQHPGVVPVHEVGWTDDGRPFLAMKLVEGATLAERLAARTGAAEDRLTLLSVFERMCRAAAYAHDRGVLHLDLKPENVLVGSYGEVVLTDWGFAAAAPRAGAGRAADRPRIAGTPAYMAPEQARGDVARHGPRTDVFALGAVLCELLTGAPPYPAADPDAALADAAAARLDDAVARLGEAGVDPALAALARRCLAPRPEDRPAAAGAVADEIAAYLADLDAKATRLAVEAAEERARAAGERRRRATVIAASAAVVVAVTAGALGWVRVAEERAERVRAEDRAGIEALERVRTRAERARAAADDPSRWEDPIRIARDARARAAARGASADVVTQLAQAEAECVEAGAKAAAEREAFVALMEVHERHGNAQEYGRKEREYGERFAALGLSVSAETAAATTEALRAHRLREPLLSALDEWTHLRRGLRKDVAPWLAVANGADDDPWRAQVRAAAAAADRARLVALAEVAAERKRGGVALVMLSRALKSAGERSVAGDVLRRGVVAEPAEYELHHELATTVRDAPEGRPDDRADAKDAVRHFEAALALRPDSAHARIDLAQTLLQTARHEEAEEHLRRALAANPAETYAHHYLGVLSLERRRPVEALTHLRAALACDSRAALPRAVLGGALLQLGRAGEAEPELRRALAEAPWLNNARFTLGRSLAALGRTDAAIEQLRRALAAEPGRIEERLVLGRILAEAERTTESLAEFRECARSAPDSAEAWCNAGQIAAVAGAFDEAAESLERGHRLGTARAAWPYPSEQWLADVRRLRDADRAWGKPAEVIASDPEGEWFEALVVAAHYAGRHREAAELFEAGRVAMLAAGESGAVSETALLAACTAAVRAADAFEDAGDADAAGAWRRRARMWFEPYLAALESMDAALTGGTNLRRARAFLERPDYARLRAGGSDDGAVAAWAPVWRRLAVLAESGATASRSADSAPSGR